MPKKTIEILNTAEPARRPSRPSWFLNTTFAVIFGGVFAVGVAVALEYFDTSFRTVTDVETPVAAPHRLHPNYPNPFNPSTHVRYDVGGQPGERVRVRIAIYDVRGALVRSLIDADRVPGSYLATWDGLAESGTQAASGVYFCSMRAGDFVASRRMVLLK